MRKCNREFFLRNDINPEEVSKKVDCVMQSLERINPIVSEYGFFKDKGEGQVSVVDIVGVFSDTRRNYGKTIFETMDDFFDSKGDGYHSRSVGMLEYNKDNVIEGLKSSFRIEPITVCQTGEKQQYTIYTNGLHRFTVLKALCLKELADANGDEQKIEKIRNKYTIPADITEVDLEQTYCKYLLMETICDRDIKRIKSNYDEKYRPTGKVELITFSNEKRIVDTEELLQLTRTKLEKQKQEEGIPYIVRYNMDFYQSFREFMNNNFGDILEQQNKLEGGEKTI